MDKSMQQPKGSLQSGALSCRGESAQGEQDRRFSLYV